MHSHCLGWVYMSVVALLRCLLAFDLPFASVAFRLGVEDLGGALLEPLVVNGGLRLDDGFSADCQRVVFWTLELVAYTSASNRSSRRRSSRIAWRAVSMSWFRGFGLKSQRLYQWRFLLVALERIW